MANSARWAALRAEITQLRNYFLPAVFDPTNTYPDMDRVQANAKAFLVLAHAEMEAFLEEWARELVGAAEKAWGQGHVTLPVAFLLMYAEAKGAPNTLTLPKQLDNPQRISEATSEAFQKLRKAINDNNGVKEGNVLRLLGSLGVPVSVIGGPLLEALDEFGSLRGIHAHKVKAVLAVLAPQDEYDKLEKLLKDVQRLDEWLGEYRAIVK